jgi:hypothetical protein
MKPSIARIVLVTGAVAVSNGATVAPAMITRVWSDTLVNLTVFPDCAPPVNLTSVSLHPDAETARGTCAFPSSNAAYWPPRV